MNCDEMGRCVAVIVLCLMLGARLLAEEDSKTWLTREPNGTFDITYSIKGRVENGTIAEYLAVEPLPKSSVYQGITWVKKPPKELVATFSQTDDQYLRLEGVNMDVVPSLSISFKVTFYKVRIDFSKIGKTYPYDKARREYKVYTRTIHERGKDASGTIREWDDLQIPWVRQTSRRLSTETHGDVLAYIRKAYELVSEEFEYYDDDASGIHPSNLLQSIESKRGHCGLRHRVFVTLLRAAGIPARTKNCNRPSGSPHVWAEFYLERYGWIPVNVARKAGDFRRFGMYDDHCIVWNNDSCLDIKSPTGRECRMAQTRGRWYWKSKSHKGKPIIEWEMRGTRTP